MNNAGNFYAGFFEELSPEQVRNQIETLLFGPMNVTRAVLPVMRGQRAGLLITISSTAGLSGLLFCSAYAAAKFGVEGWMESLSPEMDGKQGGDPAKLADALVHLAGLKESPARFAAGADALQTLEAKANALLSQANAYRELSSSLAHT